MGEGDGEWHPLGVSRQELQLHLTLTNGQCFHWRKQGEQEVWIGILAGVVVALKQVAKDVHFQQIHPRSSRPAGALKSTLREYFHLTGPKASVLADL